MTQPTKSRRVLVVDPDRAHFQPKTGTPTTDISSFSSIAFFHRGYEATQRYAECCGDPAHIYQRNVSRSTFYVPDVSAMYPRKIGQTLLRNIPFHAQCTHRCAKRFSHVV